MSSLQHFHAVESTQLYCRCFRRCIVQHGGLRNHLSGLSSLLRWANNEIPNYGADREQSLLVQHISGKLNGKNDTEC